MSMTTSIQKTVGAASVALLALAAPAVAGDFGLKDDGARKFEWSVTATGTSDYIFRGLSLSGEDPVFQASVDGSYGIWYFGAWGSMVDGAGSPVEIDFYTGIKPVLGPVTFDFGVVYYTYFWADHPSDVDYVELKAGAEISPVKNLTLGGVFWYTPDQSNYPETWTLEGTAGYELPQIGIFTPTISGLIGYTEQSETLVVGDRDFSGFGVDDYTYWNVGLALAVEKFTFDFRYWDTNIAGGGDGLADERFVFTASITLP